MASKRRYLINGAVSLLISVGITALTARNDTGPYDLDDLLLAVALSSFLSGFFASYFTE